MYHDKTFRGCVGLIWALVCPLLSENERARLYVDEQLTYAIAPDCCSDRLFLQSCRWCIMVCATDSGSFTSAKASLSVLQ